MYKLTHLWNTKPKVEVHSQHNVSELPQGATFRDRGLPAWGSYLSLFFSILTGICVLGLATVTVLLQDLIVARSDSFGLMALLAVGAVPVIGLGVVAFAASRALSGFRDARKQAIILTDAAVGILVFLALTALHPLVGLGVPIAVVVSTLAMMAAARFGYSEAPWDFDAKEAVSFLSGRDRKGLKLAQQPQSPSSLIGTFREMAVWIAVLVSCGLSSWLAANSVVAATAVPAIVLCSAWSSFVIARQVAAKLQKNNVNQDTAKVIETPIDPEKHAELNHQGLVVEGLSVVSQDGRRLLSSVGFDIKPGQILGILGAGSDGKSLLGQALVDPYGLDGMSISGSAMVNDLSLWDRTLSDARLLMTHQGDMPNLLAASSLENMCSFDGQRSAIRARQVLETLVPSSDALDRILMAQDATQLSRSDQKALELARSFFLAPAVYVFDRPEAFMGNDLITSFAQRLAQETRAGRMVVLITDNRALLQLCDVFLVLEGGRRVDIGPAAEVEARQTSGWQRFTCDAELEAEEALESWLRTRFRRKGDEKNRRRLCTLGAELLAVACQGQPGGQLNFDFKHFVGHCVLKLSDDGPLFSSGQIQRATQEAQTKDQPNRSPLARLLAGVQDFEQATSNGKRSFMLKIQSDDPRKKVTQNTPAKAKG